MANTPKRTTKQPFIVPLAAACGALAIVGAAAALLLTGGAGASSTEIARTCSGPRTIVLDLSSQNRSDEAVARATDVISAHAAAAAICDEALHLVGVAGGTQVILDPDTTVLDDLKRPNERSRAHFVSANYEAVQTAVAEELAETYATHDEIDTTSVPALYEAAASQLVVSEHNRVVILTTGVHDDADVSLNQALEPGAGTSFASQFHWAPLGADTTVAIVGLVQMDTGAAVPGDLWPREITSFNQGACSATGATCHLYQVARTDQALV